MSENNYYFKQLDKEQQKVYHAILTGLQAMETSITVPKMDGKVLSEIYFLVRMDHPEIFYSVTFKCRFYPQADSMELIPEYLFPKKQLLQHKTAVEARIAKLARPAEKMSIKEKEIYIHDFICENVRYDKLKKSYSHEIIGPLTNGVGVCEGIAKTVKILCDKLGIWCIIALSDNNPEKGIKYRHTWNIICMEGKYYHLDVTFDNSLGHDGVIRYDYFNVSDTWCFRDHEPVLYKIPKCDNSDAFYYKEKKISFTKYEDVAKRAEQACKKGKVFLFHWRGGYMTREVLGDLMKILEESAMKKGKHAHIFVNWAQSVLQVQFEEAVKEIMVDMEEANEGEKVEEAYDE